MAEFRGVWADIRYYLTDHLGSVVATINSSGALRNSYEYLPWGIMNQSTVADQEKFNYTDHVRDEEFGTNYLYCGARYYDPKLRTFLAVDPMYAKYPEWGRFVYCEDNPIGMVDVHGDSAEAKSDDPGYLQLSTADKMGRSGELGTYLQQQLHDVDALTDASGKPLKTEQVTGMVKDKHGNDIPDAKGCASMNKTGMNKTDGQPQSATITINLKNIRSSADLIQTMSHEFSELLTSASIPGEMTPKQIADSHQTAKKAEGFMIAGCGGWNKFIQAVRLFNMRVVEAGKQGR